MVRLSSEKLLPNPPLQRTGFRPAPEVCFWALAGGQPMRHGKSTAAGQKERRDLLDDHEPSSTAFVQRVLSETRRKDVQPDDVLDALMALITAETPETRLKRLAGEPQTQALCTWA